MNIYTRVTEGSIPPLLLNSKIQCLKVSSFQDVILLDQFETCHLLGETCYFHIQRRQHTRVSELSVGKNENKFTIRLRSACITQKFLLKFSYLDTKHTINLPVVCMDIELGLS